MKSTLEIYMLNGCKWLSIYLFEEKEEVDTWNAHAKWLYETKMVVKDCFYLLVQWIFLY